MIRTFKLEKFHAGIVPESTLFKVLKYLDRENIETPFLLIDGDKVKEKAFTIGRHIKIPGYFMLLKQILT